MINITWHLRGIESRISSVRFDTAFTAVFHCPQVVISQTKDETSLSCPRLYSICFVHQITRNADGLSLCLSP